MENTPSNEPQKIGREAEERAKRMLLQHGRQVQQKAYKDRFDLLVDNIWRCEVKVSSAKKVSKRCSDYLEWTVNFQRHGILKEDCDLYIIVLNDVPGFKASLYLVERAPVGVTVKSYTLRNLVRYGKTLIDNLDLLCQGKWQKEN